MFTYTTQIENLIQNSKLGMVTTLFFSVLVFNSIRSGTKRIHFFIFFVNIFKLTTYVIYK